MKSELKSCNVELKISDLETIDDSFVQEVVSMWKDNNRKGTLCYFTDDDRIISFILLEETNTGWTIRGTWTDPDYRHQGLGSQLLRAITTEFTKFRYFSDYRLWVNITPGAEGLYKKNGFVIYGQRTDTDPPMSVGLYSIFFNTQQEKKMVKKKFGNKFEWYEEN